MTWGQATEPGEDITNAKWNTGNFLHDNVQMQYTLFVLISVE